MTSQGTIPAHHPVPLDIVADDALDNEAQVVAPSVPSGRDHLLRDAIAPLDSYTKEGIYWADLPFDEQVSFVPCRARKRELTFSTPRNSFDVTVSEVELVARSE